MQRSASGALVVTMVFAFHSVHCESSLGSRQASKHAPDLAAKPIEFIVAPALTDVVAWVAAQKQRATASGYQSLVYVGASWCEPCEVFHKAAVGGVLNADFPNLRLLQFDSDRDSTALAAAGYGSEMIPLFAEIADDGRASGRKIAGAVKGQAAIAQITPRLKSLLAPPK